MKYILYLLIFVVFASSLTSCDSESPSSSNSTTKELEVTPSKTSVGIYETFTIKARMTNTPLSDIKLQIDYGDGIKAAGYILAGTVNYHTYDSVGTYTVTVKAIDVYTEDTIATKSLQIIVNDVIPLVAFDSDIIDRAIAISRYGAQFEAVTFTFTTNTFISKVRYQFGDGVTLVDSTSLGHSTSHTYKSPGTYKVILDVYNDKGDYWASDTMTCIVRLAEATLDMLMSSDNVTVAFAVDSTSSMYPSVKSYEHLEAGIGNVNDAPRDVTWTGNSFDAHYVNGSRKEDYHFTGVISSDFKKLETMTVSVIDSSSEVCKYGYTLSDLELYGTNNEVVVYRAVYRPLSSFASDTYLSGNIGGIRRVGNTSDMIHYVKNLQTPRPYAYVVFTRK